MKAFALLLVLDPPGHPDIIRGRHQNDIPSRQGKARRDARAFRSHGVLDDLYDHSLPDMNLFPYRRVLILLIMSAITKIEKRIFLLADVDEGRLHARQHILHSSLVDVADEMGMGRTLDPHFNQTVVLRQNHTRLFRRRV